MTRSTTIWLLMAAMTMNLVSGCASPAKHPSELAPNEADRDTLIKLDEALLRSQIVQRDAAQFDDLAVADFRVLAPGGMV